MAGRDIVAVGASAGGVDALTRLVRGLPADFPSALFVVLHVPADSQSALPLILSRAGLAAIKDAGGMAVVQSPDDALVTGMPTSALENVDVDYCLPVDDIGPLLYRLTTEARRAAEALSHQRAGRQFRGDSLMNDGQS